MTLQLQIEKLKGFDNYKAWSMTVEAYLESEDLMRVLQYGPGFDKESRLKDARAKFIILCLIETTLCQSLECFSTARDLWSYLSIEYTNTNTLEWTQNKWFNN